MSAKGACPAFPRKSADSCCIIFHNLTSLDIGFHRLFFMISNSALALTDKTVSWDSCLITGSLYVICSLQRFAGCSFIHSCSLPAWKVKIEADTARKFISGGLHTASWSCFCSNSRKLFNNMSTLEKKI